MAFPHDGCSATATTTLRTFENIEVFNFTGLSMRRVAPPFALKVRSAWGRNMARRKSRAKARLSVEALEGRALMSSYGVDLKGISAWGGEPTFIDVRHTFLPWGIWDGGFKSDPTLPLTPQGYPTGPGAAATGAFVDNYPDGTYQVSYKGTATLVFDGVGK